ncbi:Tyrosine-protein kinase Abl [Frankliniella fusca]|uniref:Tyrosine-protein kinase Abl n=1 Tax=Frankliniella fusca TaxID=407009 RepID=A0AAE1HY34_9NEOP|nr:Tyrosine-protein kinase Abl [Frankliniella fusca]
MLTHLELMCAGLRIRVKKSSKPEPPAGGSGAGGVRPVIVHPQLQHLQLHPQHLQLQHAQLHRRRHGHEVEKELQGAAGGCTTPLMSYKKPHAGSTGNIHGLVVLADQAAASDASMGKLSTFGGGKNSMVQMRRPTNKRGKQPPAPPKRTSLLSSCSSFRDSTYADQDHPDDAAELNGIDDIFQGITRDLQSLTASQKGDSESELQDQTPDTDDSGAHSYTDGSAATGAFFPPPPGSGPPGSNASTPVLGGSGSTLSSFKRQPAQQPVMGNRAQEQRGKKSRTYPPKEAQQPQQQKVQVAALEVQNVKRAINRYGTLPKGARIGAYLESLRVSGLSVEGEGGQDGADPSDQPQAQDITVSSVTDLPASRRPAGSGSGSGSPRTGIRTQPQMIRSNSSGGFQPGSPTGKSQRNNRGRHDNVGSSLRTFRSNSTVQAQAQGSPSPSRAVQPTLADLEFPPPPQDLPPPDDAYNSSSPECRKRVGSLPNAVPAAAKPPASASASSASPRGGRRLGGSVSADQPAPPVPVLSTFHPGPGPAAAEPLCDGGDLDIKAGDVSNPEPSVEEASFRFGVSLRHREPSTDSCSSARSRPRDRPPSPPSPLPPLSPSTHGDASPLDPSTPSDDPESDSERKRPFKSAIPGMKEMLELKLVAEIKERASGRVRDSPLGEQQPAGGASLQDPAARLVAELAAEAAREERLAQANSSPPEGRPNKGQGQGQVSPVDFKANLRKVSTGSNNVDARPGPDGTPTAFKAQLKKTPETAAGKKKSEEVQENPGPIIDFKSRLRKVDGSKADADDEAENDQAGEEGDDKRRSTGSISSLKKLWETKENEAGKEGNSDQISPKMANRSKPEVPARSPQLGSGGEEQGSPEEQSKSRGERRVWPPQAEDKPAVPTKPVVRPAKPTVPPPSTKPPLLAIYATPVMPQNDSGPSSNGTVKSERDSILEISQALETSLASLKTAPSVSTSSWLQLSDKVGLLHTSCMGYADSVGPPHARFHLRELLTRLEAQARQLRSAGARNSSENSRLCTEVHNTVKDVVNAVQR